jgi:tRNA (mo5U34)-methyltransferase
MTPHRESPTADAIARLGPWFHNLHLPDGHQTRPDHPLGDFPRFKWAQIADVVPTDLRGMRALDVGCNAGFYTFEIASRGAAVLGIDCDDHYLDQARWAARHLGLHDRIELAKRTVYGLDDRDGLFDVILFMGVFYHLRYPLLGLDLVRRRLAPGGLLVFQTLTMPGDDVLTPPADVELEDREQLVEDGWPKMAFVERRLADDPTNWWAPNHAACEALLRSAGLRVVARPGHEIYVCRNEPEPDPLVVSLVEDELRQVRGEVP